jgi:hypothetical protein
VAGDGRLLADPALHMQTACIAVFSALMYHEHQDQAADAILGIRYVAQAGGGRIEAQNSWKAVSAVGGQQ